MPHLLNINAELEQWEKYWQIEHDNKSYIPDNVTITLVTISNRRQWFPNVYTVLCLVAVVPSSSNSCERSISKLRLIKTFSRLTMGQDRFSSLALMNIHREIRIDFNKALDIFDRLPAF